MRALSYEERYNPKGEPLYSPKNPSNRFTIEEFQILDLLSEKGEVISPKVNILTIKSIANKLNIRGEGINDLVLQIRNVLHAASDSIKNPIEFLATYQPDCGDFKENVAQES